MPYRVARRASRQTLQRPAYHLRRASRRASLGQPPINQNQGALHPPPERTRPAAQPLARQGSQEPASQSQARARPASQSQAQQESSKAEFSISASRQPAASILPEFSYRVAHRASRW